MVPIFEINITLDGSEPRIWRRIQVAADTTFYELHYILQFAMGWTNSHLHQFIIENREEYICPPWEDIWEDQEVTNSKELRLSERLATPGDKMVYEYDFGDGWTHILELIQNLEPASKQRYPQVTAGEGACPPEDCGGIGGYVDLLEKLKKPRTKAYKELMEWLGGDFDPQDYDLVKVNQMYFKNFKKVMKEWDDYAFG